MTNPNSFRYDELPFPIEQAEKDALTLSFNTVLFSENGTEIPPKPLKNSSVAISRKMWTELTHIFFNENDFQQNDGVLIDFGYNIPSKELILLFQGFATLKEPDGDDFGQNASGDSFLRIDDESKTEVYRTHINKPGGTIDPGGTGSNQRPPDH
jgi:hypothetical protein